MEEKQIKKRKKKGFTLIELIIVLAVMAIIAAIAIPNFAAVRDNSKKKADIQSCETIRRTVLTMVADGTIATPASDATYTVSYGESGVSVAPADAELAKALKDTKKPQYDSKTTYTITVKTTGDVVVTTGATGVEAK